MRRVLVTGGAGYVGAHLCPRLLNKGYEVRVIDTCWYGQDVFPSIGNSSNFELIVGDIRDLAMLRRALEGCTDVIHLACISNDPSYDLDPYIGESINFQAFEPLVLTAKSAGISRFIYASSSSVYGVKEEEQVTEDLELQPLTDYSRYKATCEQILQSHSSQSFTTVTVRPATVCGYSPRQRLDVIVNILTNNAVNRGNITVHGGSQFRPNLHIDDMCRAYESLLEQPQDLVQGETFNVGGTNHTVMELAKIVKDVVPGEVQITIEEAVDARSYRISSARIFERIGFQPEKTVADAVRDLVQAFSLNLLPDSLTASHYFNLKKMNEVISAIPK